MIQFKDFGFKEKLAFAVRRAGFSEPSPIQAKTIPHILEGKDVVGQAHTGTGKTAAFALPLLEKMKGTPGEILVIVPTRELAIQVADEFYKFSRHLGIRTTTIYGGTSYKRQILHTQRAGVIVATPGRLLDLLSKKLIKINPRFVVLDEADEMLNMGFIEDIRRIFQFLEGREQTLMFSATMPEEVKDLSQTLMKNPLFVRTEQKTVSNNNIQQYYYVVEENERDPALLRLLETSNAKKSIVFCRTKKETERVAEYLSAQGFGVEALHGDVEQRTRQKIMKDFRYSRFEILVATDVAARGLDIKGVTHVINYHIPFDPESYVHRIGRTGRAKRSGVAMMLVTPHELSELTRIQQSVGSTLRFHEIPHVREKERRKHTFFMRIHRENTSKEMETLFREIMKELSLNEKELSLKLLSLLVQQQDSDARLGKSFHELKQLMQQGEKRGIQTPSSKGRRHARKGTRASQTIPQPKIKKMGGSRIVARRIF